MVSISPPASSRSSLINLRVSSTVNGKLVVLLRLRHLLPPLRRRLPSTPLLLRHLLPLRPLIRRPLSGLLLRLLRLTRRRMLLPRAASPHRSPARPPSLLLALPSPAARRPSPPQRVPTLRTSTRPLSKLAALLKQVTLSKCCLLVYSIDSL